MSYLSRIVVFLTDLSAVEVDSIPDHLEKLSDVTKDIMKHGCYSYEGDVATYIPPASISKIQYHREKEEGEEEDEPEKD